MLRKSTRRPFHLSATHPRYQFRRSAGNARDRRGCPPLTFPGLQRNGQDSPSPLLMHPTAICLQHERHLRHIAATSPSIRQVDLCLAGITCRRHAVPPHRPRGVLYVFELPSCLRLSLLFHPLVQTHELFRSCHRVTILTAGDTQGATFAHEMPINKEDDQRHGTKQKSEPEGDDVASGPLDQKP